ncbi:Uncharacterised protein [Acinetobacter baumannii]|nr:Uncharacterised protein [Acinetobacter baumannii]
MLNHADAQHAALIFTLQPRPQRAAGPDGFQPAERAHLTAIQHQHLLGQPQDLVQAVADIEDGNVHVLRQPLQIRQQLAFARQIERGQRFVHQQQFRRRQQRAADRHPLFFTAGERQRQPIKQRPDAQQLDDGVELRAHAGRHAVLQVAAHPIVREQARILKHIADTALFRRQAEARGGIHQRAAIERDAPLLQTGQAADGVDQ